MYIFVRIFVHEVSISPKKCLSLGTKSKSSTSDTKHNDCRWVDAAAVLKERERERESEAHG